MDFSSTPRARFSRKKFISSAVGSPYRSPLMNKLPEKKVESSLEQAADELKTLTASLDEKNDVPKENSCQVQQTHLLNKFPKENTPTELKVLTSTLNEKNDSLKEKMHHMQQKFASPIATSSPFRSPFAHDRLKKEVKPSSENVTLDELKATAIELWGKNKELKEKIHYLEQKGLKEEELKCYMDKLHRYNDIKDVAQTVMGRLAILELKTIKEVHEDFGMTEND